MTIITLQNVRISYPILVTPRQNALALERYESEVVHNPNLKRPAKWYSAEFLIPASDKKQIKALEDLLLAEYKLKEPAIDSFKTLKDPRQKINCPLKCGSEKTRKKSKDSSINIEDENYAGYYYISAKQSEEIGVHVFDVKEKGDTLIEDVASIQSGDWVNVALDISAYNAPQYPAKGVRAFIKAIRLVKHDPIAYEGSSNVDLSSIV